MSKRYPGGLITKTPVVPTSLSAPGVWSLSDQAAAQATNTWPFPRDPQFKNVTMLLHGDGSGGPTSLGMGAGASPVVTNFNADASTNNFNVTINGDARSNNFTPYQEGYYSNYFDGSGDYLTVPSNAALNVGSSTFTLECWFYNQQNALSGAEAGVGTIAAKSDFNGSNTNGYSLFCYDGNNSTPSTNLRFFLNGVSFFVTTPAGAVPFNTWTHIAVVKSGTNLTIYCNGVSSVTSSSAPSTVNDTSTVFISGSQINGTTWNGTYPLSGRVSNLRLVKGTAVYTAAFTPPTAPLTAITNTSLLTCQSNRFIDNSTNAFTITKAGDTAVSPAIPFTLPTTVATYGSGYFDGTGDYLTAPSNSAFAFGTGDFTVECWAYFTSVASFPTLTDSRVNTSSTAGFNLGLSTAKVQIYTTSQVLIGATTLVANTWYHIAVTRSGTTLRIWLNGVQDATVSNSTNWSDTTLVVGATPSGVNAMTGYMTDTRLVKGTAVYTASFTPPTTPLTAITNTSLLTTQYNGGGNNSGFKDSSQFNFPITRNGNTTQGTFTPYGSNWSNYFDGSGDYLTFPSNATFAFGTGDFTVEFWVNETNWSPTGGSNYAHWISINSYTTGIMIRPNLTGTAVEVWVGNTQYTFTTTLSLGVWYHIAVSRSSSSMRFFVNGTQIGSTQTVTYNISTNTSNTIGTAVHSTTEVMQGYLSNLRIVSGSAVYTSNFTPSTTPLTAITNTQLLTCQSNRFIDNSTNAFTITKNGDTSVQRFSPFSPTTAYSTSVIGGSGYFDGSGDYLSAPSSSSLQFGTGLFTVEAFIYLTASNTYQAIVGPHNTDGAWVLRIDNSSGLKVVFYTGSTTLTGSATIPTNSWVHVAVVREGTGSNQFKIYINGTVDITNTVSNDYTQANSCYIGAQQNNLAGTYFNGYISNLRLVKGSAVYTTTFTPPTAPLTAITNTSLLLNYTNAGILDNAMMNDLETVGNAQISTSVKKYGTGSMYFDGSGDYLFSIANQTNNFGTGNFTVECWVYFASVGNAQLVSAGSGSNTNAYYWQYYSSQLQFGIQNVGNITATSWTPTANTWYFIAVVRSGTNVYQFVNGTQLGTTATSSQNFVDGPTYVGFGGAGYLNGYIDDLRITKGVARYTATFTVPDQAFPNG